MDFFKCKFQEVYDAVKHHSEVLERAVKLRILDDFELDLLSLIPLYECGILSELDFRRGADRYFNN